MKEIRPKKWEQTVSRWYLSWKLCSTPRLPIKLIHKMFLLPIPFPISEMSHSIIGKTLRSLNSSLTISFAIWNRNWIFWKIKLEVPNLIKVFSNFYYKMYKCKINHLQISNNFQRKMIKMMFNKFFLIKSLNNPDCKINMKLSKLNKI